MKDPNIISDTHHNVTIVEQSDAHVTVQIVLPVEEPVSMYYYKEKVFVFDMNFRDAATALINTLRAKMAEKK